MDTTTESLMNPTWEQAKRATASFARQSSSLDCYSDTNSMCWSLPEDLFEAEEQVAALTQSDAAAPAPPTGQQELQLHQLGQFYTNFGSCELDELEQIQAKQDDQIAADNTMSNDFLHLYEQDNQRLASMEQSAVVLEDPQDAPPSFVPPTRSTGDLLHRMVVGLETDGIKMRSLLNAIEHTIDMDPAALSRQAQVWHKKEIWSKVDKCLKPKKVKSTFSLPMHMAIESRSTPREVIILLLDAAKDYNTQVLEETDGPLQETPLLVLLRRRPSDAALVDDFLSARPTAIHKSDRRANTPLHVACAHGAVLRMIRHLHAKDSSMVTAKNEAGETPLGIAENKANTKPAILDFLRARTLPTAPST